MSKPHKLRRYTANKVLSYHPYSDKFKWCMDKPVEKLETANADLLTMLERIVDWFEDDIRGGEEGEMSDEAKKLIKSHEKEANDE